MFLAGEAPAVPPDALNALMPPWAQGLSLLTLLIFLTMAWLRGWIVTKSQNEKDVAAERRVSDIWEKNFNDSNTTSDKLISALAPVLASNQAILKAVTEVQEEQRRMRERGQRR